MPRRVILLAKAPLPGAVKTRLCPPLAPAEAAALAAAFLRDSAVLLAPLPGTELCVAHAPQDAGPLFRALLGGVAAPRLIPQAAGDLGRRLAALFRDECPPSGALALLGCDTPDLPSSRVEEAFRLLEGEEAGVVLGPTRDGGYYLVAARRAHSDLFREIPWGTPEVLESTLRRAAESGLRVRLLPPWEDVDVEADLLRLRERLRKAPPGIASHTRAFLSRLPL